MSHHWPPLLIIVRVREPRVGAVPAPVRRQRMRRVAREKHPSLCKLLRDPRAHLPEPNRHELDVPVLDLVLAETEGFADEVLLRAGVHLVAVPDVDRVLAVGLLVGDGLLGGIPHQRPPPVVITH
ncbi:hypothetical protein JMJ77_0011547 [Colletotrichum scovillei]|uniref:Uncharacterized protein n=1 Tax=Colletotrichum scovillei TaxID=1209932 RepID=A0A9P7QX15_9PEZI|nr:hypothetical protein JMJ77_0011547 [Colletotrichum scovillei]KAG7045829.1 hypothetical protein JMJ78_0010900 [Colletotrichum scovillei]KAG7063173.1 hypothetical protein JMJ76_0005641 [Colletotrichum scovillei]